MKSWIKLQPDLFILTSSLDLVYLPL